MIYLYGVCLFLSITMFPSNVYVSKVFFCILLESGSEAMETDDTPAAEISTSPERSV